MTVFGKKRLDEALDRHGGAFRAKVGDATFDLLVRADARKMLQIIDVAIGVAATRGRDLLLRDFDETVRLCGQPAEQKRFGFL